MVSDAAATKAPIAKVADKVSGVFVPTVSCTVPSGKIVASMFASSAPSKGVV